MAAIAAKTAQGAMRREGDVFSGALARLRARQRCLSARSSRPAGRPSLGCRRYRPSVRKRLADALSLGAAASLALAGGFAFLGDCLLLCRMRRLGFEKRPKLKPRSGRAGR